MNFVVIRNLLLFFLFVTSIAFAQEQVLQITAPANGAQVFVGQTLGITVTATPGAKVPQVAVYADEPLGVIGIPGGPPYQFTLAVTSGVPYGTYRLTAVGRDPAGNFIFSAPVTISVEPLTSATTLSVQPTMLSIQFVGQQIPLSVSGHFADGTIADLSDSAGTIYSSSNSGAVIVSTGGLATATGAGNASVMVQRASLSVQIPVTVPVTIRGDLNDDGVVDLNDLNILMQALNTPATVIGDARDLNGDGVINALDVRILVTLCTRPACATH